MSACRRQNGGRQTPESRPARPAAGEPAVRRYVHPIRTARPCREPSAEERLIRMQAALERQTVLLEELLRRTNGNAPDTN